MRSRLTTNSNVLITGMTGLIGGEIFRRFAARSHRGSVWALVRATDEQNADQRVSDRLARSGDFDLPEWQFSSVVGDIVQPDWGLTDSVRDEITETVDIIIHNAADTSFVAHRDTARTNVEGIERLIDFARTCRRQPLIAYMSTASNVGRVSGLCLAEDDGCRPDNDHFNEYTHSKAVGEQLLLKSGLPVLVLRPTIVLPAGLPDPVFARQILWCAPITRVFGALPVNAASRLDVIDVGFVAEATLRLLEAEKRAHDCYHLSAGVGGSVTLGQLAKIVDKHLDRASPIQLIPPKEWTRSVHREFVRTPLQRRIFRSLRHYLPFMNMDVVYDDARFRSVVSTA